MEWYLTWHISMTFDGANKYCEESIEKLQQLAHYIKERKKIEEEYAHSLSPAILKFIVLTLVNRKAV